ncbi:unnamed protein product, partial [Heterosigma akashiwo]
GVSGGRTQGQCSTACYLCPEAGRAAAATAPPWVFSAVGPAPAPLARAERAAGETRHSYSTELTPQGLHTHIY